MPNNKKNRRSNNHTTQKRTHKKNTKRNRKRKYNHNNVRSIQRKKTRRNKRYSTARGMWVVDKLNKKQIQQNANRAAEKIRDARAHAHAPAPPEGENAPTPPEGEKIQEPLKDYSISESKPNGFFALKKGFIGNFKNRYFIFLPSNYGPHRSNHLYWYKTNNPETKEGVDYKGELHNFTTEIDPKDSSKLIIKGSNYDNSSRLKRILKFDDKEYAEHIYKILTQTVTPKDLAKYTNLQDNKRKMEDNNRKIEEQMAEMEKEIEEKRKEMEKEVEEKRKEMADNKRKREEHAKQMKKNELQNRLRKSIYSQTIHPQNKSSSSLNTSSSSIIINKKQPRPARTLNKMQSKSKR